MDCRTELMHLAALRHSRGISLEEIARRTRIAPYYLQAIEDGDFQKLPAGVYRDSFLWQYAEAIDRDLGAGMKSRLTRASRENIESQINSIPVTGWLRAARDLVARGTTALMLCNASNLLFGASAASSAIEKKNDPRLPVLKRFFAEKGCPAADWAVDFLIAADRNGLDWRLLPSIAFLESTGGKYSQLNNPLGWNLARTEFRSNRHAVHYVANRLARSAIYQKKTLRTKLRIYNPDRSDYPDQVMAVMEQISAGRGSVAKAAPAAPLRAALTALR